MFQLNKPPSQPIEHSSISLSRPLSISLRKHLYSKFHAPASAARLEFTILKILIKTIWVGRSMAAYFFYRKGQKN